MIDPTEPQQAAFFSTDQSESVVFINCHRYRREANYPDDYADDAYPANVSGREAYHRYFKQVSSKFVPQVGGKMLLAGPVDMVFIGKGDWEEVIVGHYPSKAAAMSIPVMPGYDDIAVHRVAGLEIAQTMVLTPANLEIFNFA